MQKELAIMILSIKLEKPLLGIEVKKRGKCVVILGQGL